MPSISRECPFCRKFTAGQAVDHRTVQCPECSKEWGQMGDTAKVFERCPICACRQFYIQKDFSQGLGCLIMLIGIILVPFTFGLSLPVFAFADWILHKRVPTLVICYKCLSEFRGFVIPKEFKPFMHHIGVKYDKKS